MIMPYGVKPTGAPPGGLPEIDFNALWDRALRPAIIELGYDPVRADQDVGALIVHEMLERLYFSDLVLADMTIPNGNVYYEVGVRHACCASGCVLLAADWARPLFDVAQMRLVKYPLSQRTIDEAAASAIRTAVTAGVRRLKAGQSPMYEVLPGYPGAVDPGRASTMRSQLDALGVFQQRASQVRAAPTEQRLQLASQLAEDYCRSPPVSAPIAYGLLKLFQYLGAWQKVLELTTLLPPEMTSQTSVVELTALASSKVGRHAEAIGLLDKLIQSAGPTSEREGLLGGRYKELYRSATGAADKRRYLNELIRHYEQGMMLDLNDYYPSSNLPSYYRLRGAPGDLEKAAIAAQIVYVACQRAKLRNSADEFLKPTLLGAAFNAGDVRAAQALYDEIAASDNASWQLATTLPGLELSLDFVNDTESRARLRAIIEQLRSLC